MNRYSRLFLASLALGLSTARAEVVVIANAPGLVGVADVREVFLGDKQFGNGNVRLVPLENAAVQAEFLAKVVKMDAAKYHAAWTKKAFRDGVNPPATRPTDADVVEMVKRTPGAIGYVGAPPPGVAVVARIP
ncbi:MAG TPA: hypothetical protein VFV17_00035 [Usitatibacteraceae bacterium]|nr:hypothetical protein [Usitatibacteraceae bacterium]